MINNGIVLCFEGSAVVFLVEVGITIGILNEFSFFIALSFVHLEVKFIFILEVSLEFELVDHVLLLMIVLCSFLVVLLLFKNPEVRSVRRLGSFAILALGDSVLEC